MTKFELFIAWLAIMIGIIAYADDADANPVRTISVAEICGTKTSTVRNVSQKIKTQVYRRDGVPGGNHTGICNGPGGCEVDHKISLEIGGSNDDITNLMIQPYFGPCNAHDKDKLENRLHRMICAGEILPDIAQDMIYNDWQLAYVKFVDARGCQ